MKLGIATIIIGVVATLFMHFYSSDEKRKDPKTRFVFNYVIPFCFIVVGAFLILKDRQDEKEKAKLKSEIASLSDGQQKMIEKQDSIKRFVGDLMVAAGPTDGIGPNQNFRPVPLGGIIVKLPEDELKESGTFIALYKTRMVEGATVIGKNYLFDLFNTSYVRDRLSLFFQAIEKKNYLVMNLLDSDSRPHVLLYSVDHWGDGENHYISMDFNAKKGEYGLWIDKGQEELEHEELTIKRSSFKPGRTVYIGRSAEH